MNQNRTLRGVGSCVMVSLGVYTVEVVALIVVILGLSLSCLSSLLFFLPETVFHPSSGSGGLGGVDW